MMKFSARFVALPLLSTVVACALSTTVFGAEGGVGPTQSHIIKLAATTFETANLVATDAHGGRIFLEPTALDFSTKLLRPPFESGTTDLFIVQASDPATQIALRSYLAAIGASIRDAIPSNAYLVRLTPPQLEKLRTSASVFWIGLFQPAWKISPRLSGLIEADPQQSTRTTAVFDAGMYHSERDLSRLLGGHGLEITAFAKRRRGFKVLLTGPAEAAHEVAVLPGLLWIEPTPDYRPANNIARTSASTATGRGASSGPLMDVEDVWTKGLHGEGQVAAISDTGLSTGDLATIHPDFGRQGSVRNPPRLVAAYALGRPTWDDDQSVGGGHGTHVAGSFVGNGIRSGADPTNDNYPGSTYAGAAPKASLVFQSLLDAGGTLAGIPADLNTLFQTAYDDGARVHSNSWGAAVEGAYTADSQEVDEFVWNHPDMVITFSAGNGGEDGATHFGASCVTKTLPPDGVIDDGSIQAPGTAKNAITVGSTENYRPSFVFERPEGDCTSSDGIEQKTWGWLDDCTFSPAPLFGDLMADNASGLAAISARGPTEDGRIKPDLVAPGVAVISTRTDMNQSYQEWGLCEVAPELQPYYITMGGSSSATALTAGAAVLVRQYYSAGWHGNGESFTNAYPAATDAFNPSAALVKATLINGAWDITPGQYGTGAPQEIPPAWDTPLDLPNSAEGYGRVDLEGAIFPSDGFGRDPGRDFEVHDVSAGLATGAFVEYSVSIASSVDPLVVTLVWTDPFASLVAVSQLVNDLDLTVTSPTSTVYFPNGVDRTAGSADRTNTVEQVKVTAPVAGAWTVRVSAFNVPGNGELGTTAQPFALVISGVLAAPCSDPAAPTGLTAAAVGSNRIDLSWNTVAADSYSVHRATMPGGPYERLATGIVGASYSDTAVSSSLTYYYIVTAVNDPNCESATSNESSAAAFGDCLEAPSFAGLTSVSPVGDGSSCVLRLSWPEASTTCAGPPVYSVYRSTTSSFAPGPATLLETCITGTAYDDGTPVSGTEYFYVVRAEDAALGGGGPCRDGNVESNDTMVSATVGADVTTLLFADDFDGGQQPADLWYFAPAPPNPYVTGACAPPPTGSGPISYATDWYRAETGFCSGNSAASNDGAADPTYSETGDGSLILGPPPSGGPPFTDGGIVLPVGVTSITLTFDHDYDFEATSQNWDGGRVRVSVDDWPNFVDLAPVGAYPGSVTISDFFCTAFPSADAYVADSGGCVGATFDLTAYAGSRVWISWNHGSDDDPQTNHGWAIDNVRLEARTTASCAPPPRPVQFLTATATDGEVEVEWQNPNGAAYGSTMIRYREDVFPADPNDGDLLAVRAGGLDAHDAVTHSGLTNGTHVFYSAFVDDGSGVFSARRTVEARPFDTMGAVHWEFSSGATRLGPPSVEADPSGTGIPTSDVWAAAADRGFYAAEPTGATSGRWPVGWTPSPISDSVHGPPIIVELSLGGASRVAFLGSQDGRVYAMDADFGAQIWSSPDTGGAITGTPAGMFTTYGHTYDLIIAATRDLGADNRVHGFDLADGTIAWTFTNSVAQAGDGLGMGPVTAGPTLDPAANRLYVTSRASSGGSADTVWCVAFDDSGASKVWSRAVGDVDAAPLLVGSTLYAGNGDGEVHALDATTGAPLWAAPFTTEDGPVKDGLVLRYGTSDLLFSTTSTVWSIADTGPTSALNWSISTIPDPSMPGLTDRDLMWVGGGDGRLQRLDISGAVPSVSSLILGDGVAPVGRPTTGACTAGLGFATTEAGRLYGISGLGALPRFSMAFTPVTVKENENSTLVFLVDAARIPVPPADIAFDLTLPAGLEVAAAPAASTTCDGGTLITDLGSISYSAGAMPSGQNTCTVTVTVTARAEGTHLASTSALASHCGSGPPAEATLSVNPIPVELMFFEID